MLENSAAVSWGIIGSGHDFQTLNKSINRFSAAILRRRRRRRRRKTDKGGNFVAWVGRGQELGFWVQAFCIMSRRQFSSDSRAKKLYQRISRRKSRSQCGHQMNQWQWHGMLAWLCQGNISQLECSFRVSSCDWEFVVSSCTLWLTDGQIFSLWNKLSSHS